MKAILLPLVCVVFLWCAAPAYPQEWIYNPSDPQHTENPDPDDPGWVLQDDSLSRQFLNPGIPMEADITLDEWLKQKDYYMAPRPVVPGREKSDASNQRIRNPY